MRSSSMRSNEYTVDDAIERSGFGCFQIRLGFITAFLVMCEGMELAVISILGPILVLEWKLSAAQLALLSSGVFIGYIFGSLACGSSADKYGRRKTMTICAVFLFIYGILSAAATTFWILFLCRCLYGLFCFAGNIALALNLEYNSTSNRAMASIMTSALWSVGISFEVLFAFLLIPNQGWRIWLIVSATPILLYLVMKNWCVESVRFYNLKGDVQSLETIVQKMFKMNKVEPIEGHLITTQSIDRGRFTDLLLPQYRSTIIFVCISIFCSYLAYYGFILLQGMVFSSSGKALSEDYCILISTRFRSSDYHAMLYQSAAEVLGLPLTAFLLNKLGRRNTLCLLSILPGILSCSIIFVESETAKIILFSFIRICLLGETTAILTFVCEIFPTTVRITALGCVCSASKLGAVICPVVCQILYLKSPTATFVVLTVLLFIGGICIRMVPVETAERHLQESRQA
ncbi:SVOP (predicted) [Pycnogonum litorale]